MDRIRITGGNKLNGIIPISGAKNAALPLMIASLLTSDTLTLENVPHLADVTPFGQYVMTDVDAIGVIAMSAVTTPEGATRLLAPDAADAYARGLYDALRRADAAGIAFVVAVPPDPDAEGVSEAIADRLRRASAPR